MSLSSIANDPQSVHLAILQSRLRITHEKLKQQYPKAIEDVGRNLKDIERFIIEKGYEPLNILTVTSKSFEDVRQTLSLVWTAASDRDSLVEGQVADDIIGRKMAVIESLMDSQSAFGKNQP